ncbi:Uncharacterised protein [Vibrio cholerae]|nr:Uncharacterised protein [Vibrio cholerae]
MPPQPAWNDGGTIETRFSFMILLRTTTLPPDITPRR